MKPRKLVCGVGINDADYAVAKIETVVNINGKRRQKQVWACPYYRAWASMLKRCYSTDYKERNPTYIGCTVSDEWLTFSNFRAWMEKQDFEGKELDKDLLFQGNKLYSSDTCMFVTKEVNMFTTERINGRGEWLIGVDWHKASGKFQAQCKNPFTKKSEHLGLFTCEQKAHNAWLKRKLELACELAAIQTDSGVAKALIDRYSKPQCSRQPERRHYALLAQLVEHPSCKRKVYGLNP